MHRLKFHIRVAASLAALLCVAAIAVAQKGGKSAHGAAQKAAAQPSQPDVRAQLTRENNFGVALMNRQQFESALGKFQRACILDPQTDVGCLNSGIALLNMQQFEQARAILAKSAERDPQNPRPWFNLGLLEKATGHSDAAIEDFQKAAALDPADADSEYFLGLLFSQQQQYEKAIAAFQSALKLNPFHVSAEFGLAQALQRTNDLEGAKKHLDRFQHLTAEKLGKPISFIYGEQGKYSLAQLMPPAPEPVPPAVPVHFTNVTTLAGLPAQPAVATGAGLHNTAKKAYTGKREKLPAGKETPEGHESTLARFLGSGACILDYDGDGKPDIFLVNADGKGHAALFHNLGRGKFANVTKAAKLEIHGEGMGCAVGRYVAGTSSFCQR
jgi:tetratricopeptide (TPR) repeat protein